MFEPPTLSDDDREWLRSHHGLSEEQIEAEERALRESYVPNPQYRNGTDRRSVAKRERHRKRLTKEIDMTVQHVSSGRTVPLNKLRLDAPIVGGGSWTNIREFSGLDGDEIEALGKRIKHNGIVDPLKVQMVRIDGEIIELVIDGQRRYLGAKSVFPGNHEIPVVDLSDEVIEVLTPEAADELTLKALTTLDREDLTTYELMTVAEKMKARGKTLDYIGKAIGRDPGTVSKFLTARKTATPKLMLKWRKGEITDEQFKDLASVKDPEEQAQAAKEIADTRKSGDKTEARVKAKEIKETAKNGHNKNHGPAPKVTTSKKPTMLPPEQREQTDMFAKPDAPKPVAPKPPSRLVLEEFLALADKRPPTSDLVKCIFLGAKYAMGLVEPSEFGKAWDQYIARIEGKPSKSKAKKLKASAKAKPGKAPKAKGKPKRKPGKKSRK